MTKVVYELDGRNFRTLEDFYDEVSRVLVSGAAWGRDLDALNDLIRGGFGTPRDGFVLRWVNAHLSRDRLGYPETVRRLKRRLTYCHPSNRAAVSAELREAKCSRGPTVFDWIVAIIRRHGPGGEEQEDGVGLVLDIPYERAWRYTGQHWVEAGSSLPTHQRPGVSSGCSDACPAFKKARPERPRPQFTSASFSPSGTGSPRTPDPGRAPPPGRSPRSP